MKISKDKLIAVFLVLMSLILFCKSVMAIDHASYTIDVYQSRQVSAEQIDKKFRKQFEEIASVLLKVKKLGPSKDADKMYAPMEVVIAGIHGMGDFSYLSLSPIIYPGSNKINITVDIVDKRDDKRLQGFLPKQTGSIADPDHLIESWLSYNKLGFDTFLRTKKSPVVSSCPAFHCVFGFDDPALKNYAIKFNAGVPKYKTQLVEVLRNDKDENRRGAAAFLLAHLKNGNEIIQLLVPSMRDSSSHVRNNVMRVLAQTAEKLNNPDFPISEAVLALRYPAAVDRNKALYIVLSLINQPRYASYIKQHAAKDLIDELKLDQPNLHDTAYLILKSISHKNYSDHDFKAWEKWVDSSNVQ